MKNIFALIISLFFILEIQAQDSYYFRGESIPLFKDSTKVVSISSSASAISAPPGFMLASTITDSRSIINVYEIQQSEKPAKGILYAQSLSKGFFPCYISEAGNELVPNGYINVKFHSMDDVSFLQQMASQFSFEIIGRNRFMPLWYSIKVKSGQNPVEVANKIFETGVFAASFPSFSLNALEISYDENVYEQWGLYNSTYKGLDISISKAWSYATGRGIKIAIVDQGIDLTHQDLQDNIYQLSYDTESDTSPSRVYDEHGTHCAGIAAAVRNNGIQIAGVAPDAKLMSISNSLIPSANMEVKLANGINWAWQQGADIISCSWYCTPNDLLEDAIDDAVTKGREGKGCVFVKSAGNSRGPISYPGNYSQDVLAVANMTIDGTLHYKSCYGDNMFVAAPGTDILSTIPGNKTKKLTGTSMACPHVAGLAALILERNPNLPAKRVREIIARTAKKVGNVLYDKNKEFGTWNERYGYGLIDAYNAVLNTPR